MDIRESLKKQIDELAAELNVAPGYQKNASAPTLEKRLAELEDLMPDDTDTGADADPDTAAPAAAEAPKAPEKPDDAAADRVRMKAQCRFRTQVLGESRWIEAHEIVLMTADEAAQAQADRVAIKAV